MENVETEARHDWLNERPVPRLRRAGVLDNICPNCANCDCEETPDDFDALDGEPDQPHHWDEVA